MKRHTDVKNVESRLLPLAPWQCTKGSTLVKSHTNAVYVTNLLVEAVISQNTKACTLGKNDRNKYM